MNKKKLGNVVGYIRVSTEEQANEGYSLLAQEDNIRKYLLVNQFNYESLTIIADEGRTGTNFNRPGIQKIIKNVANKKIDTLLFLKLDRIGRNVSEANDFFDYLFKNNIKVLSIAEGEQTSSAGVRFITNVMFSAGQYESEATSERTKNGIYGKAQKGEYPLGGKLPLGISKTKDFKLYYNEDIEKVKYLFELMVSENFTKEVVEKYIKRYPNDKMDIEYMRRLSKNSLYRGYKEITGERFYYLDPIISSNDYRIISTKNWKRKRMYDKHTYSFKNKVFINNEKSKHTKCKGRSKYYKYYYIKGHYIPETLIEDLLFIVISEESQLLEDKKNEKLKILAHQFLTGNITFKYYNIEVEKMDMSKVFYQSSVGEIKKIDINTATGEVIFEFKNGKTSLIKR